MAGLVEVRETHVCSFGNRDQIAFQIVGPVVIGAGEGLLGLADGANELCAAMPADVVERSQPAIPSHDDKDVVQPSLNGDVLARLADILGKARISPGR